MGALLSSLVSTTRPWLCGSEQGEPSARARKNICTKDVRKDRNENGFGFLSLLELSDDCTDGSNSQNRDY